MRGLSSGAFLFKTISPGRRSIRPTTQNKPCGVSVFSMLQPILCFNQCHIQHVIFSNILRQLPTSLFSTSLVVSERIPLCVAFQTSVSTEAPPMHPISPVQKHPKTFMCIGVAKEEASCSHAHIPGAHCTILGHSGTLVYGNHVKCQRDAKMELHLRRSSKSRPTLLERYQGHTIRLIELQDL